MSDSLFRISAEKLFPSLDACVNRAKTVVSALRPKYEEWYKLQFEKYEKLSWWKKQTANPPSSYAVWSSNPWRADVQRIQNDLDRLIELQKAVNLQISIAKNNGWDGSVLLATTDTSLLDKWLNNYVDANRIIEKMGL